MQLLAELAFRHPQIACLRNCFEAARTPALVTHRQAGFEIDGEENGLLRLRLSRERWEQRRAVRLSGGAS